MNGPISANPAASDGTANRNAVQHAGKRDVVDVPRSPGNLPASFFTLHGFADEARLGHLRCQ